MKNSRFWSSFFVVLFEIAFGLFVGAQSKGREDNIYYLIVVFLFATAILIGLYLGKAERKITDEKFFSQTTKIIAFAAIVFGVAIVGYIISKYISYYFYATLILGALNLARIFSRYCLSTKQ